MPKFDVDGDEGPEAQAEVFFDVRGARRSSYLLSLREFAHLAQPVSRRRIRLSGHLLFLERWEVFCVWSFAVGVRLLHHLRAGIIEAL